mmetsp:Transcript_38156/g.76335  ORF Transcript_38156/g.76335 Transcript_38156/m.76335 type:complete len:234 (-) Transcript_38156:316-1017(-)
MDELRRLAGSLGHREVGTHAHLLALLPLQNLTLKPMLLGDLLRRLRELGRSYVVGRRAHQVLGQPHTLHNLGRLLQRSLRTLHGRGEQMEGLDRSRLIVPCFRFESRIVIQPDQQRLRNGLHSIRVRTSRENQGSLLGLLGFDGASKAVGQLDGGVSSELGRVASADERQLAHRRRFRQTDDGRGAFLALEFVDLDHFRHSAIGFLIQGLGDTIDHSQRLLVISLRSEDRHHE